MLQQFVQGHGVGLPANRARRSRAQAPLTVSSTHDALANSAVMRGMLIHAIRPLLTRPARMPF